MKKLIILLLVIIIQLSCGNWLDWTAKDGSGDPASILLDARKAFKEGEYDEAAEYYSNIINYYIKSDGDKNSEGYWKVTNDSIGNYFLAVAYAGRATTLIKKYFGTEAVINSILAFVGEDEEEDGRSLLEAMYYREPRDPQWSWTQAEEAYKIILPVIKDELGTPYYSIHRDVDNPQSVGDDLKAASHYSLLIGDNGQAIDFQINYSICLTLGITFSILDTDLDFNFGDNGIRDANDLLEIDKNFNINANESVFENYNDSRKALEEYPTDSASCQDIIDVLDVMINQFQSLSDFQTPLNKLIEDGNKAFYDVLLNIVGNNSVDVDGDGTPEIEAQEATDPEYEALKDFATDIYSEVYYIGEEYNQLRRERGDKFTTLYGITKSLNDFIKMKKILKTHKLMMLALKYGYVANGDQPLLPTYLLDPANYDQAIDFMDQNDGDADIDLQDIDEYVASMEAAGGTGDSLFSSDKESLNAGLPLIDGNTPYTAIRTSLCAHDSIYCN